MSDTSSAGGPVATPADSAPSSSGTAAVLRAMWRTPPAWARTAWIAIVLLFVTLKLGGWAFHQLASFIGLLFLAWMLSIAIDPAVVALHNRGMRRGFATGLVMLTLLVATVIFFAVFGNLLVHQMIELFRALPGAIAEVLGWINRTFKTNIDISAVQNSFQIDTSKLVDIASNLGFGLLSIVRSIVGLVFQGFMLLLFAFYMSAEAPQMQARMASWFPARSQRVALNVWEIARVKTGGYVFSRMILAIVSATFTSAFLLIINVPYWLPLGIWVGLVSQFIPTIGTYLGGALPVIIALTISPFKALLVVAFILLYQQLENYLFAPKITARTVDIHPALAFGSVVAGGALFGAWGALVAIPVVAAIESVIETYGRRYELIPELRPAADGEEPVLDPVLDPAAAVDPPPPAR
jgi:predicted PurR-regulated permease PerM